MDNRQAIQPGRGAVFEVLDCSPPHRTFDMLLTVGPHDYERALDRQEALFAQALDKHFDEPPVHATEEDEFLV